MNPAERFAMAGLSAITAFVDPARGDLVALLGETTAGPALRRLHSRFMASPEGRSLLQRKPRIRTSTLQLGLCPAGSFGAAYAAYLDAHAFSPDERQEVLFIDDPELRWVLQRYREVHDFWHVLAGLPPSVLGEVAVKWLEMVQSGLPSAALSALVAPLRLPREERVILRRDLVPWAVRCGRSAVDLMTVDYEAHFEQPLDEVRALLRFEAAPLAAAEP
jgi:ubiquinone biosynthesis protein COQ4